MAPFRFVSLTALSSLFLLLGASAYDTNDVSAWYSEAHRHLSTGKKLRGDERIIIDPSKVTQLSWKPRAFLFKGFLSHEECDHLIDLAKNRVKRSTVVGSDPNKEGVLSDVRTSSGTFLPRRVDPTVTKIEKRISAWTFLPEEHGEDIQVLRYNHGEKYGAHHDSFRLNTTDGGGYRVATVLMYLSDVPKGGETVFPLAQRGPHQDENWSECGKSGLGVKPVKGDALLFFSLHPNGTMDNDSLHTGCPVVEGVKWSATKWIHESKFGLSLFRDPSKCVDENPKCAEWAAAGECIRNPTYMVRNDLFPGYCRKSCNACTP